MRQMFGNIAPEGKNQLPKLRPNVQSFPIRLRVLTRRTEPPLPHSVFMPCVLLRQEKGFALCSGSHPPTVGGMALLISFFPSSSARFSLLYTETERQKLPQACDSSQAMPASHSLTHISETHPTTAKVTSKPRLTDLVGHPSKGPN